MVYLSLQVLPGYGESVCVQLLLLAGAVPHLHNGDHTDKCVLFGVPTGLLLFHAVRRLPVNAACLLCASPVGLAHCLHLRGHLSEESAVCTCASWLPLCCYL